MTRTSASQGSVPRLVLLRADAGRSVGYGHVMRCLTLGAELIRRHWTVVLMAHGLDHFLTRRASDLGIDVIEVMNGPEAEELSLIGSLSPLVVVIDGYHFSTQYVAVVRSLAPSLVVIDDNGSDHCGCADLVLNQNLHAVESMYPNVSPTRLLLGPQYALVRTEVSRLRGHAPSSAIGRRAVLVALGGTDVLGLAPQVASALSEYNCEVHLAGRKQAPRVLRAPADIAESLANASVAVIGGGSTMLEACCLGVPAVVLVVADNQVQGAAAMRQAGLAEVIDCRQSFTVGEVARAVMALLEDSEQHAALRRAGRDLVDGLGGLRVSDAINRLVAA